MLQLNIFKNSTGSSFGLLTINMWLVQWNGDTCWPSSFTNAFENRHSKRQKFTYWISLNGGLLKTFYRATNWFYSRCFACKTSNIIWLKQSIVIGLIKSRINEFVRNVRLPHKFCLLYVVQASTLPQHK